MKKFISLPRRQLAIGSFVVVAFCYSLLGVAARLLSKSFEPMTQVYARVFVAFLLSLIVLRKRINWKKILSASRRDIFWLIIMGALGYSVFVFFITQASLYTKLVNVSVIYATIPFFAYLYSFFLLGEKIKPKLITLILLSLYGVSLISAKSLLPSFNNVGTGEVYALLSVLCAGTWSIGRKKLKNWSSVDLTVVVIFIAALSGFIIALSRGEPLPSLSTFDHKTVWLGLAIGGGLNTVATVLENFGFSELDVVFGNQLLLFSNIFSLVLGYLFYKETIGIYELAGGILIILSVYFANKIIAKES